MRRIVLFFVLLNLISSLLAIELKFEKRVVLKETSKESIISFMGPICPLENKGFFIADIKELNFKIFDLNGNHLGTYGRGGQGPGEFSHLRAADCYQNFIYILDSNARRIVIYQQKEDQSFVFKSDLRLPPPGPTATWHDLKLKGKEILISGEGVIDKQLYCLYSINPENEKVTGLVPYQIQYGYSPYDSDWQSQARRYAYMVTGGGIYFDYYNNLIFFIWGKPYKITKYDSTTNNWKSFFMAKTDNFKPDKPVSKATYFSPSFRKQYNDFYISVSHVFGLMATNKIVAILFNNYYKKNELWQSYMHIYSHEGKLIKELIIPEAKGLSSHPRIYYDKSTQSFYISQRLPAADGINEEKAILIYRIIE